MEIDPLRNLARTARKVPGYRKLRRQLVPRIRRNKAARKIAHRIFGTGGGGRTGADLTAGSVIDGVGTEGLPVALIVVPNTNEASCRAVVDQVARAQLLGAGFKPLFLLDAPLFAPFRAQGWPADLLIPASAWGSLDVSYEEYVGHRIARLTSTFAATTVVRAADDGLTRIDEFVLTSMTPPSTTRRRR